jgi:hypothetical protein
MHTAPKSKLLIWLKNSRESLHAQKGTLDKNIFFLNLLLTYLHLAT